MEYYVHGSMLLGLPFFSCVLEHTVVESLSHGRTDCEIQFYAGRWGWSEHAKQTENKQ